MSKLTDHRIFDQQYDDETFEPINQKFLLEGAESRPDITLQRVEGAGALASIVQRWVIHSPAGFEWGYGGSGPADLALNILGEFVPPPEAWRLHQYYKGDVIARLDRDGPHVITAVSVVDWITGRWAVEGDR